MNEASHGMVAIHGCVNDNDSEAGTQCNSINYIHTLYKYDILQIMSK